MVFVHHTNGAPIIKIQTSERIDSLNSGYVYMKSLKYYSNLERENPGDVDVGDEYEAQVHINSGYMLIPELNHVEILKDQLIHTSIDNAYVFCLLSIPENASSFTFTDIQKEKLTNFGDNALTITDRDEFVKRLSSKLESEGYTVLYGHVRYYDPTIDNALHFVDLIANGIVSIAFRKRKKYSYQQEFRIVAIKNETQKENISVNIGDISDISKSISLDKLLSATFIAQK